MKKCSYCGRENGDEAVDCGECGTEFARASEPPRPEALKPPRYVFAPLSAADRQKDLVTLVTCGTLLAADIVAGRLRAAGIEAFIPDEFLMQVGAFNPNTYGFVRVQVAPKEYEAAKDLLTGNEPAA